MPQKFFSGFFVGEQVKIATMPLIPQICKGMFVVKWYLVGSIDKFLGELWQKLDT